MAQWLKQSTAVDVLIGPFVDDTDGKTEESGLTISQADVLLSKNGQALAQKNDATACAFDDHGCSNCELDATDTGTLGTLDIVVYEAGALPVRHSFMVVAGDVYDQIVGGASEYGTAQAGAAGSITLATSASTSADFYNGQTVWIVGGTGAGQSRQITDYTTGRVASIEPNWVTNPDGTSIYVVLPTPPATDSTFPSVDVGSVSGSSTAADNLEVVFDTDFATNYSTATDKWQVESDMLSVSGDSTAADNLELAFDGTGYDLGGIDVSELNSVVDDWLNGGRLDLILDAALADTNELQTDWANGGRLDLILDAILDDTDLIDDGTSGLAKIATDVAAILVDTGTTLPATLTTILADTNELQGDWVNGGRLDLLIDGIKSQTDKVTFTVANQVDANIQSINDVALTGDGSGTPFNV